MVSISKDEAKILNSLGVCYKDGGISKTHNKAVHYFLCEAPYNMNLLKKIREGRITN